VVIVQVKNCTVTHFVIRSVRRVIGVGKLWGGDSCGGWKGQKMHQNFSWKAEWEEIAQEIRVYLNTRIW